MKREVVPLKKCEVKNCFNNVLGQDGIKEFYCNLHYRRILRNGTTSKKYDGVDCSNAYCDRPARTKGLCSTHYSKYYRDSKKPVEPQKYARIFKGGKTEYDYVTYGDCCAICFESRALDFSHIIPAAEGGNICPLNILVLCPTHHRLFDRGKLNEFEQYKIRFRITQSYENRELTQTYKDFIEQNKVDVV